MSMEPQQKRAKTKRERILSATQDIAKTDGCAFVTTTALARRLDVSVGTIYRYFAKREDAIAEAYDIVYGKLIMTWLKSLPDLSEVPSKTTAAVLMDKYIAAAESLPSFLPLLEGIREIRSLAEEQAKPGMPADDLAYFVGLLGLVDNPKTPDQLSLLRHLTSDLSHLYLLSDAARREVIYQETVDIISGFLDRMRQQP